MTIPAEVGVNETTAFMFCLDGGASIGNNQNFPSGPSTRIPGVSTVDDFWREYFRYFLYYQMKIPSLKSLRVAVGYDFGSEETYNDWKVNPAAYWNVFDSMVKWATAASVDLIPVIMHCSQNTATVKPANRYMTETARTAHLVEFARALMTRYDASPSVVCWDLLNEPCPSPNDGSPTWVTSVVSQVRSATTKPITMGFDAEFIRDPTKVAGGLAGIMGPLDIWQDHFYADNAFLSSVAIIAGWAAPKQFLAGEIGTNLNSGYFPAAMSAWVATGNPACAMALWNGNIGGPFPTYPYTGVLPDYPSLPPPPPPSPPPPVPIDLQPQIDALAARITMLESALAVAVARIAVLEAKAMTHAHKVIWPATTIAQKTLTSGPPI